jgi:hypothetical protein
MDKASRSVYIDPSYAVFLENKLFDLTDINLNRDGSLEPFVRARTALQARGITVNTADFIAQSPEDEGGSDYYSLGILENIERLAQRPDIRLKGFVVMEPPVAGQALYALLPQISHAFEQVYIYNTSGDGYSLQGVDQSRLRKFYCLQPVAQVSEPQWSRQDRLNRVVVINGNHKPQSFNKELYSKRIEAMVALARFDAVDLYGRGWTKWFSRRSLWLPYWLNLRKLLGIYHGECDYKIDVLSQYRFCLCFENMAMAGYVTEKIFDCFYAGTIPLYLGAPDIDCFIPAQAYIDVRQFSSWSALWQAISSMTPQETERIRQAGRDFLASDEFNKYYHSFENIISGDSQTAVAGSVTTGDRS